MGLDEIQNGINGAIGKIQESITAHPTAVVIGSVGAAAGLGAGIIGAVASKKRRKKKSKKARKKGRKVRRHGRKLKFGSKAYRKKYLHKHRSSPHGKLRRHRHRGGKGIHYTKKGQPYVIMSSGKARFISKRGAKQSKKRKGGRY